MKTPWPDRLRRSGFDATHTAGAKATGVFALALIVAVLAVGCGTSGGTSESAVMAPAEPTATVEPAETSEPPEAPETKLATPEPTVTSAPVPFGSPLPRADIGEEALAGEEPGPQPVSIMIEDLDIVDASVVPVGVNDDETFEVPEADEVGWYEFGPSPGVEGSSVLAAHIAYDGVDGVFRSLSDAEIGAVVAIGFDDGSTQRFRIESVTDYVKEELPASLFARDGDPQLALITCGGAFHPELRSYDSNTVAVAVPV